MPLAPSFSMLPVALQELFLLCFEQGHGNPAARPTADVWSKALGEAEDGLGRWGVNGQHYYSGHLGVCPWCERSAKLGGRDPFPALGAIRAGQHLKPAAIVKAVEKPILKPFFPPNISGTQQSQIASFQSRTITNSQTLTTISSTTYTPQPTQTNYANNQTSKKISVWENFFHIVHAPNLSLITRLYIICIGGYVFPLMTLLPIYVIIIGIQGMNAFALIMGGIGLWVSVYELFVKNRFRINWQIFQRINQLI